MVPPPPLTPCYGQKAFLKGGGGGYILNTPAAGFLYPPSLLYIPHPWEGIFWGWGVGVHKIRRPSLFSGTALPKQHSDRFLYKPQTMVWKPLLTDLLSETPVCV